MFWVRSLPVLAVTLLTPISSVFAVESVSTTPAQQPPGSTVVQTTSTVTSTQPITTQPSAPATSTETTTTTTAQTTAPEQVAPSPPVQALATEPAIPTWTQNGQEVPFASGANFEPLWAEVKPSVVTLNSPLPSTVGPHPAACDKIKFLRYRHANGPTNPQMADSVMVIMPGIYGGAGSMDAIASNVVSRAATKNGQHVEVWAIDRRSNCLEDHYGIEQFRNGATQKQAVDYYLSDVAINGRKFKGWGLTADEQRMEAKLGMEQTVNDYYEVIKQGIPDPAIRSKRVICSGHSIGGIVTGIFSAWDFDGNPATKDDAGYKQCAGYVALDSIIANNSLPLQVRGTLGWALPDWITLPENYVNVPVTNPQISTVLAMFGVAAAQKPKVEADLWQQLQLSKTLPRFPMAALTVPFIFSKDPIMYLFGGVMPDRWRMTNEAALGLTLDDNFFNASSVAQVSVGFGSGGQFEDKNFPLPNFVSKLPIVSLFTKGILGGGDLAFPSQFSTFPWDKPPLYTWTNYNQVTSNNWTNASQESSDIRALARSFGVVPLDFTEKYFPVKLLTDLAPIMLGERKGAFSTNLANHMLYDDQLKAQPTLTLFAEHGPAISSQFFVQHWGKTVVLPGYQHLDPVMAAPTQNGGKPEPTTEEVVQFIKQTTSK